MISLRPYQERFVAAVRDAYLAGHRSVLGVMPCGAGKTRCFAHMLRLTNARGRRGLVLCHTTELVGQAVAKLAEIGVEAEIEQGSLKSDSAPVVVASIASLRGERLANFPRDAFGLLVHDEAHRTRTATSSAILHHFRSAFLLGVTATPARADGRAMGDAYSALVIGATIADLTDQGHLVPARTFAPGEVLRASEIAASPVDAYVRYGNGERAIVFAGSVDLAERYAREANEAGIPADFVTGESKDRAAILQRFAAGETRFLASVNILVEGFDDPGASIAILARRFNHVGSYIQAVGRVLRPAPGKRQATIVDLCGSALVHGTPDTEREYSLDGKGIRLKDRLALKQCPSCFGVETVSGRSNCPLCGEPYPIASRPDLTVVNAALAEVPKVPPRAWHVKLVAKRADMCRVCTKSITKGELIVWAKGIGARHFTCAERTLAA